MLDTSDAIADLDDVSRSPAFIRLMADVGFVMFQWSRLEDVLVAAIRRLRSESGGVGVGSVRVRGSFSERVAEWRALLSLKSRRDRQLAEVILALSNRLERLRQKRSMIAHNFVGASLEGGPHILCSSGGAGSTLDVSRIPHSELIALMRDIVESADQILQIDQR